MSFVCTLSFVFFLFVYHMASIFNEIYTNKNWHFFFSLYHFELLFIVVHHLFVECNCLFCLLTNESLLWMFNNSKRLIVYEITVNMINCRKCLGGERGWLDWFNWLLYFDLFIFVSQKKMSNLNTDNYSKNRKII